MVSGSLHDSVVHCIFTYVMNGHNGFCVTSHSCHLKNSESVQQDGGDEGDDDDDDDDDE